MAKINIKFRMEVIDNILYFQVLEQRASTKAGGIVLRITDDPEQRSPIIYVNPDYPDISENFRDIWLRGSRKKTQDEHATARDLGNRDASVTLNLMLLAIRAWAQRTHKSSFKKAEVISYEEVPISEDGIYEF